MSTALLDANGVFVLNPSEFCLTDVATQWTCPYQILSSTSAIIEAVMGMVLPGDAVIIMSNRGFENIHQRLIDRIEVKFGHITQQ
jgi:UDP-N-acetylmuramate: L-alanyl-gamma-D-glutamyl-meso-diaminopimelate ligase